jgi:ribosome maturation factor RimP
MRDALMRLLEPPIEALDYELVDVEFAREGRGGVLRVYIDRPATPPGAPASSSRSGGSQAAGLPVAGSPAAGSPVDGPQAGITVDDCARVSHAVSEVLETEDPIKGHYSLEVSSPGFDRILRKREHFERFVGERMLAELKLPIAGRRRFIGVLKSIVDDSIVVEVDGQAHTLPLAGIQKARLRPE